MTEDKVLIHSEDIYHWGIHGQQWGKRRYQNEDGSLTPLGRIHYGVGEAKERSKIKIREMKAETKSAVKLAKAQAKAAKAVANAEKEKIAAKTKEYRDRKEADNIVELERIKAQREADRQDAKNEAQLNKNLAEATKENAEESKRTSSTIKTVLGIVAAAGVGYMLYRAATSGSVSSESSREAAEEAIKKIADKPASELISHQVENASSASNAVSTVASNATKTVSNAANKSDKNLVNLTLGKVSKNRQAEKAGKQFGDAALQRLEKYKSNVNAANKADAAARVKEAAHQFDIRLAAGNKEYAKNAANASKKVASGFRNMINRNSNKMESFEEWLKNNGKTVFTARHSDMGGKVLIHTGTGIPKDIVICHYGIKGQKHGIRRYQNEDGSYTMAGKYRYGIGTGGYTPNTHGTDQDKNKDIPKFSQTKNYKDYATMREFLNKYQSNNKLTNNDYIKLMNDVDYMHDWANRSNLYSKDKKGEAYGMKQYKRAQFELKRDLDEMLDKGYNRSKAKQAEAPRFNHDVRDPNTGRMVPYRNKFRNGEAENSEIGKNMTESNKTTMAQIIKNKIGDINVPKTTLRDKLSKDSKKPDIQEFNDQVSREEAKNKSYENAKETEANNKSIKDRREYLLKESQTAKKLAENKSYNNAKAAEVDNKTTKERRDFLLNEAQNAKKAAENKTYTKAKEAAIDNQARKELREFLYREAQKAKKASENKSYNNAKAAAVDNKATKERRDFMLNEAQNARQSSANRSYTKAKEAEAENKATKEYREYLLNEAQNARQAAEKKNKKK